MIEIPEELIEEISSHKDSDVFLIAIDGSGGAGKSTIATELSSRLGGSQIVHIDDFYKPKEERIEITDQTPVHSNFEFERLKQQVLQPLGRLTIAKYKTSDGKEIEVQPNGFVVIEGLGTLGAELRDFFDYRIWVESSESTRRERGIRRDTEEWTKIWDEEYLPQDARYVKEQAPQNAANFVLNNG